MELQHLKALLVAKGKTQSELAQALGRDKSAITNLLNGKRQLKVKEVPLIAAFLEVTEAQVMGQEDTPPAAANAFAEPVAVPFHGAPSASLLHSGQVQEQDSGFTLRLADAPEQCYALEVKDRAMDLAGLLPGDIVLCDPSRKSQKGDVVIVQLYADDGTAQTVLRSYEAPFLRSYSSQAGHTQLHEERANVAIIAPLVRSIRLY